MALNTGTKTSYTDTTPHVRNIEDAILAISPKDVPFLKVLVGLNEAPQKAGKIDNLPGECFSTKYEWLEDTLDPTADTVSTVSDTDGTSWTVADGTKFRTGHVCQVDNELVWVSAVSTNTLTVVRAFAGTTGATHTNGTAIEIVGIAMLDGADTVTARTTSTSAPYNYTQIFEKPVVISGTEQAIKQYGKQGGEFNYQLGKQFASACILLERAIWQGKRAAGSATAARAMGGLSTFITDNVTSLSSAALTEKDINDLLALIFADVGLAMLPQDIFVNQWLKRKISSFYAPYARMESKERAGGVKVDVIRTEFGDLNLHLGLWCPASQLSAVNMDYVGVGPLKGRGWFYEELAKTGDARKGHIVGEYTMAMKNDKAHGMLTSVSTSA